MTSGFFRSARLFGLMLVGVLSLGALSGCGDEDADQRKAFIDFLQNTVMRSGSQLPTLSEAQKTRLGHYVNDYAILYNFSQQMNHVRKDGLKPVVSELSAIRAPQDYMTHRDSLRQASGVLNTLHQQVQSAKNQADSNKAALKQSDDLKPVYDKTFNQVVMQPTEQVMPVLPPLLALSQSVVQAGDFLQQQGSNVVLNGLTIQFSNEQQASAYNTIMQNVSQNAFALSQAQKLVQ